MTGLTFALFCVLLVAAVGQFCLKIDFTWYYALNKPAFMPTPGGFTLMTSAVYVFSAALITRLVVGRHFFPSMIFLAVAGMLSAVYLFVMFRMKNPYAACVVMLCVWAVSFVTLVRFMFKDRWCVALYLPVFLFNSFCTVLAVWLAFSN